MVETAEVAGGAAGYDDIAAAAFAQLADDDTAQEAGASGDDNAAPVKNAHVAVTGFNRPHSPPLADIRRSSWPLNLSSSRCTSASTIILTKSRNLMRGVQPRRLRAREASPSKRSISVGR